MARAIARREKQALAGDAVAHLGWTTSGRADRPRTHFCFAVAEQSPLEAASMHWCSSTPSMRGFGSAGG
jgi:hypothetical protein